MKPVLLTIAVWLVTVPGIAALPQKISLPPVADMIRTDIYIEPSPRQAAGTLILCPGFNGDGSHLIEDGAWKEYARTHDLNLVGLSFASDPSLPDRGYFNAGAGSGKALLGGLRQAFGQRLGPLLLYGFSRGAQFVYSFTRANPGLVLTWCAYSATEWESPDREAKEPCGIIACGDEDEPNYSTAAFQFLQGRSAGQPWTWVSLAHTGHWPSKSLEEFARAYFTDVLRSRDASGVWKDVDTKARLDAADVQARPTLAAWLPDERVAQLWKNLHQP